MNQRYGWFFIIVRRTLRLFMRRYKVDYDRAPSFDEPTVLVSHHQNLKGPIRIMLWIPFFVRMWVLSSFSTQEECYDHYVNYTFTKRFKMPRKLAEIIALPASHLVAYGMNSLRVIPVYRQSRKLMTTLRESIATLEANTPILIFPDVDYKDSDANVGDIYEGFLTLEKLYNRKTGKHINFVPTLANKRTFTITFGEAIKFSEDQPFREQRSDIAERLQDGLNALISDEE